jgi:aspartyl-tRNA(Asn)/glutamyl-tRNA(Gln) amidotransferase subunit B
MMGDLASTLNRAELTIQDVPLSPQQIAVLITRVADGTLSNKLAKEVFQLMWEERPSDESAADRIIEAKGLKQISDSGALEAMIDEVLAANPKSVEEFRAGKEKAFNSLVGQAMKATRGKANPQQVNELLRAKLTGAQV